MFRRAAGGQKLREVRVPLEQRKQLLPLAVVQLVESQLGGGQMPIEFQAHARPEVRIAASHSTPRTKERFMNMRVSLLVRKARRTAAKAAS